MAGLRKLRGKYDIRLWIKGKVKLLPAKTRDKKVVEAFKRQIESQEALVKAGLLKDIELHNPTLTEATEDFLQDCGIRLRPITVRGYRLAMKDLIACWGNPPLTDIKSQHLSAVREYLAAKVSPITVNINLRAIRRFLNWCVETNRLERLPGRITFVKLDQRLPRFFFLRSSKVSSLL